MQSQLTFCFLLLCKKKNAHVTLLCKKEKKKRTGKKKGTNRPTSLCFTRPLFCGAIQNYNKRKRLPTRFSFYRIIGFVSKKKKKKKYSCQRKAIDAQQRTRQRRHFLLGRLKWKDVREKSKYTNLVNNFAICVCY